MSFIEGTPRPLNDRGQMMGMVMHFTGRLANAILHRIGCEVIKHSASVSWQSAFARIRKRQVEIQTVIDVGASDGRWSEVVRRFYPNASYFLIEAQKVHEAELQLFKTRHDNSDYVLAVAGDCIGELYFDESDPFGGVASHTPLKGE